MVAGFVVLLLGLGCTNPPPPAGGDQVDAAVRKGRDSLRSTGDYVWYDSKSDGVRRIRAKTQTSAAGANFSFASLMTPMAWLGVAVLLGVLVYLLIWAYLAREKRSVMVVDRDGNENVAGELDRIEDLPVKIRRPISDLLSEAREHYLAGQYGQAIIYLYSHQLVQLDRRNLIRLTRGKTNRQYLRELSSSVGLRQLLEQTMIVFEEVFFGQHQLQRERFELIWNRLDDFNLMVQQAAE